MPCLRPAPRRTCCITLTLPGRKWHVAAARCLQTCILLPGTVHRARADCHVLASRGPAAELWPRSAGGCMVAGRADAGFLPAAVWGVPSRPLLPRKSSAAAVAWRAPQCSPLTVLALCLAAISALLLLSSSGLRLPYSTPGAGQLPLCDKKMLQSPRRACRLCAHYHTARCLLQAEARLIWVHGASPQAAKRRRCGWRWRGGRELQAAQPRGFCR